MSDPDRVAPSSDLARQLADAVAAVPGVARLEPTLTRSLLRLRTRSDDGRDAADGISVRDVGPDHATDVGVDITVTSQRPSRLVAREVRRRVLDVLAANGRTAAEVRVTVLGLETGGS